MRSLTASLSAACVLLLVASCGPGAAPPSGSPVSTAAGAAAAASFMQRALHLTESWDQQTAAGVPAATFLPLRQKLASSAYETAPPGSAVWKGGGADAFLGSLNAATAAVWTAAVDDADQRASAVLDSWNALTAQYGSFVPAADASAAASWPAQLSAAASPADTDRLAAGWAATVASAQQAAQAGKAAADKLAAELQPYTSVGDIEGVAAGAVSTARADNLDDGGVPALLDALRAAVSAGTDPGAAIGALQAPLRTLRALISQQDGVAAALASLQRDIDAAVAMNTTHAASFQPQYDSLAAAFRAASSSAALAAVRAQIDALDGAVNADPAANGCDRSAGSGKVIAISLSRQSVTFYQDGCVVRTSLVTTGRAQLRTPTGTFHIFAKYTHFTFISPWPQGSPFYYYPSVANYAMEFLAGGYFLHDASWEPDSQFGPGSENSFNASHGCVHIESTVMPWLYGWADIGTTVVISA